MISDILKLIPKISPEDLGKMEKQLGNRFTKIAKGFAKGVGNAFKGGAVVGGVMSLVDKLLNPLKEVQEAIERALANSDDIVTNAKQFNTSAASLAKLQGYGKAAGLDPDNLNMLLTKYQTAVAEAAADPTKQTAVRQFAGDKDIANSFFQFIQLLQKMDKNQQVLVQKEVFGEKQILKMSDFLNSDFNRVSKIFNGISDAKVEKSLNKQGDFNDYIDERGAARGYRDIITKGQGINKGTITSMEAAKDAALLKENERIRNFENINNMNEQMNKMAFQLEKLVNMVFTELPIIMDAAKGLISLVAKSVEGWSLLIKMIKESRIFKGIVSSIKGE